ncbi:MAG: hypothetical protein EAZ57_11330 [Cytophagales bacterium]|nr:MAG: hypothetical protein EAZ67_12265 [Cytophagales bacterium]TAF59404.1 MAG: hypothetical protein EAZ57_11330 [Cytophagales bacterium]
MILSTASLAQNKKADSLKALIPVADDTTKVLLLTELAWFLRNNDAFIAYEHIQTAHKKADELNKKEYLPKIWNYEGVILRNLGNYPAALQSYYIAVKLAEDIDNQKEIAYAYNNIGDVHRLQGNFKEAAAYCSKASTIFEKLNDWKGIGYANARLGELYEEQKMYAEAKAAYEKVLKVRTGKVGATELTFPLSRVGFMAHKLGDEKTALELLNKALQTGFDASSKRSQSTTLNDFAKMYQDRKDLAKSNEYAIKALENAASSHNIQGARTASRILADNFSQLKDFKQAYKYQELFVSYTDSIFNEDKSRSFVAVFNNFEIYKREQENEILKKDQIIQVEQNKNQQTFIWAVLGVSFAMLVAIVIFINVNNKRKKANKQLIQINAKIANQNEELEAQAKNLERASMTIKNINDDIRASINYAKRIQGALLPSEDKLHTIIPEHFILFRPKDIVSGDFYWFEQIGQKLVLVVGDCTGHGVPGAFMSMLCGAALIDTVVKKEVVNPAQILLDVDKNIRFILKQDGPDPSHDGMEAAICVLDNETNTMELAAAKSAFLYFQGEHRHLIRGDRFSVGGSLIRSTDKSFTNHNIPITDATTFYMFSDGYKDQIGGPNNTKFMSKNFYDMLETMQPLSMEEQLQALASLMDGWIKDGVDTQLDDMLVLGVRLNEFYKPIDN